MTRRTTAARPPWQVDDVRDILAGVTEPKLLHEYDRKGLSPVAFAALKAAAASDSLLSLLDEKPDRETDPIQELRDLMVGLGVGLKRVECKLDRVIAALSADGS